MQGFYSVNPKTSFFVVQTLVCFNTLKRGLRRFLGSRFTNIIAKNENLRYSERRNRDNNRMSPRTKPSRLMRDFAPAMSLLLKWGSRQVINLIEVKRKGNERFESLLRRFNREIQQSGILTITKKNRYFEKEPNRTMRRESATRKVARRKIKRGY